MRRRLVRWLACPACEGELRLFVAESKTSVPSEAELATFRSTIPLESSDEIEFDIDPREVRGDGVLSRRTNQFFDKPVISHSV